MPVDKDARHHDNPEHERPPGHGPGSTEDPNVIGEENVSPDGEQTTLSVHSHERSEYDLDYEGEAGEGGRELTGEEREDHAEFREEQGKNLMRTEDGEDPDPEDLEAERELEERTGDTRFEREERTREDARMDEFEGDEDSQSGHFEGSGTEPGREPKPKAKAKGEWLPIDTICTEADELFFAWNRSRGVMAAVRDENDKVYAITADGERRKTRPTQWMQVPDAPEGA